MSKTFGELVREWRAIRRLSQLDLALSAALSARHLSFLETGRATPSRMMVLRLAGALEMPKSVANQALGAAGYAPVYPSASPDAPDLVWARRAVDQLLARHSPYPALVLDRVWNVVDANVGATRLLAAAGANGAAAANMVEVLIALADGGRVANWEDVASLTLQRLRAEIAHLGGDAALEAYAQALARHPRLGDRPPPAADRMIIPIRIKTGGEELALFTTVAQFGSAQEIALSEIKIELMFPADATTEAWFARA